MNKKNNENKNNTKENIKNNHQLNLTNRKNLEIDGVQEVISYNENTINIQTNMGNLEIKGEELNINKLNLEETKIVIDGNINNLQYSNKSKDKSKNIIKKLFK